MYKRQKLQKYDADEIVVTMQFAKEPKLSQVQLVPDADGNMMDFFVTLGTRDREVHLKGHPATNKMDPELLRHSNNPVSYTHLGMIRCVWY